MTAGEILYFIMGVIAGLIVYFIAFAMLLASGKASLIEENIMLREALNKEKEKHEKELKRLRKHYMKRCKKNKISCKKCEAMPMFSNAVPLKTIDFRGTNRAK